jgi:AraC-like DNA-binding protein
MTVSITLVRALVEGLEGAGVGRDAFIKATGFDLRQLDQTDGRISIERYDLLAEAARLLTGEDFGIRMGASLNTQAHSVTAHLVAHAANLREAIDALVRYQALISNRKLFELVDRDARSAVLLYHIAPGTPPARRFRAETVITGLHRMVRYFAQGGRPELVSFEYPEPAYHAAYAGVFEGTERFSQPFTGVVFDKSFLDLRQLHADAEFHATLRQQAARRIARLETATSYAERIREHVFDPRTTERRDMASTARALGLSARSLRRRLQHEGVSYSDVVDDALAALAKRLLADEHRSIEDTAYELGFSAPSAFHKAFKRWTGTTPKDFRTRHAAEA